MADGTAAGGSAGKEQKRSVRGWRRLTGIITALSSTAIIRSARRLTVCRFWHRHFRTARRWRFRLHQRAVAAGLRPGEENAGHTPDGVLPDQRAFQGGEGAFHVMEPDESCKRIGERMRWCWCPDWSLTVRGTGTGMAAVIMTGILQGFRSCPAWR